MWLFKINHEQVPCTTWPPSLFSEAIERPHKRKGCSGCNRLSFQVSFSTDEVEEVLADAILQDMPRILEER